MTILTTLATTPGWRTVAEIAATLGIPPIQVINALDAYTEARMVEWRGDTVTLKGGWMVRGRSRMAGPFHLGNATALAAVIGGAVEREAE